MKNFLKTLVFKDFPAYLGGIVMLDPVRLDEFYNHNAEGLNLFQKFTQTNEGDEVCKKGIIVLIIDIDPCEPYTIVVRKDSDPSYIEGKPIIKSEGWVIATKEGKLTLCPLELLMKWDSQKADQIFMIPPAIYKVTILGGINTSLIQSKIRSYQQKEYIYEFCFEEKEEAVFSADLQKSLRLSSKLTNRSQ